MNNKILKFILSILLIVFVTTVASPTLFSLTVHAQRHIDLNSDTRLLASEYLYMYHDDNGSVLIGVRDDTGLRQELNKLNTGITYDELITFITNFNNQSTEENGTGKLNNSVDELLNLTESNKLITTERVGGCSLGLFLAGSAFVPYLIGAAYGTGALFCP